jgi:hypothetical protein
LDVFWFYDEVTRDDDCGPDAKEANDANDNQIDSSLSFGTTPSISGWPVWLLSYFLDLTGDFIAAL